MKYLVLMLLVIVASCKPKEICKETKVVIVDSVVNSMPSTVFIIDTVYVEKKYDSLLVVIKKKNDSLFIERYKLERVKYYNEIAQKNSSQLKFLRGWINRATK